MFDRNQSRIIIILGLLGVFTCILSFSLLSKYSAIDFKFPLEKEEIFIAADKFIYSQGSSPLPLVRKAHVASDQQATIYVQKKLGVEKAGELLESLSLYYWQVEYVFPKKKGFPFFSRDSVRLLISPLDARIISLKHKIPLEQYEGSKALSKNEAQAIAGEFFDSIDFDISDFKMTTYSPGETEHLAEHIFEWEKDIADLKDAKLKVRLGIFGDKVGNFDYFLNIPDNELGVFRLNNIVNTFLFVFLNMLVFALGIFVLVVAVRRRKKIEWRFGFIFALLMAIAFLINFLKLEYRRDIYLALFFFILVSACAFDFIWTLIVSCVSKLFSKEVGLNFFPVKISYSILLSYIFFFSGIGFTMFFFVFVARALNPITTLGFDSFFSEFPSNKLSCLIAPFLSLSAAVFEEVFFRALAISFLKKYLKKTIWAILVSSLIWCFMHVSPLGYSDIYPGFVKGLILLPIGLLFGYIFVRFGLACAIATHYLHDLVVIGAAYLEFINFRYVNLNVITMLIAALLPLSIALYFNFRKKNA
ncbi:CPBP family intramembrane glutamic endopeptidase [Candidatus Omnitrophota bacterium]